MQTRNTSVKLVAVVIAVGMLAAIWTDWSASRAQAVQESQATSQQSTPAGQLEGTWIANTTVEELGQFTFLFTFAQGGLLVETDSIELAFGFPATNGQGVWVQKGDNEFAYTMIKFLFDEKLSPAGFVKIRGAITLNGEDAFTSTEQHDAFDPDGNAVFSASGTTQARRMTVEPLTSYPSTALSQVNSSYKSALATGWGRALGKARGQR